MAALAAEPRRARSSRRARRSTTSSCSSSSAARRSWSSSTPCSTRSASIARGQLGVAAQKVEDALAKALPLAISFLASLLGLGGISDKIREGIDRVRKPIEKAVNFVVLGAVKGFKKLFGGAIGWVKGKYEKGKAWATEKAEAGKAWVKGKAAGLKDRVTGRGAAEAGVGGEEPAADAGPAPAGQFSEKVTMNGADHTVEADLDGSVTMASKKGGVYEKAKHRLSVITKETPVPEDEAGALRTIMETALRVRRAASRAKPDAPNPEWDQACRALVDCISDYGQRFRATDIDPPEEEAAAEGPVDIAELVGAAIHVAPRNYSRGKHVKGTTEDERKESSKENGQFLVGLSDAEVAALERDALLTGELVPRGGGAFHAYKRFDTPVGWDQGQPAYVLRAELSAGRIHSHPRLSR